VAELLNDRAALPLASLIGLLLLQALGTASLTVLTLLAGTLWLMWR